MNGRRKILVVDDDDDVRETFVDALRFEGFTVEAVANGREAMAWLRARDRRGWVILLDLMMPVMDGKTFLELSRAEALLDSPVIVLTAGGDHRDVQRELGVASCLAKTVSLPKLVAVIDSCN